MFKYYLSRSFCNEICYIGS